MNNLICSPFDFAHIIFLHLCRTNVFCNLILCASYYIYILNIWTLSLNEWLSLITFQTQMCQGAHIPWQCFFHYFMCFMPEICQYNLYHGTFCIPFYVFLGIFGENKESKHTITWFILIDDILSDLGSRTFSSKHFEMSLEFS